MKIPVRKLALLAISTLCQIAPCNAMSLLIDDFRDGSFSLIGRFGISLDDKDIQYGTMLGGSRYTALTSSSRQSGVTAILVSGGSEFSFNANVGPAGLLGNQGVFYSWYSVPLASRNFTSYSGFMLSIPSVTGAGIVEVQLGSASFSVPIDQAGAVFIPIKESEVISSILTSVSQIKLQLTAVSNDFSVSINRFSAIPEPSTCMLIAASIGLGMRRSRRSQ